MLIYATSGRVRSSPSIVAEPGTTLRLVAPPQVTASSRPSAGAARECRSSSRAEHAALYAIGDAFLGVPKPPRDRLTRQLVAEHPLPDHTSLELATRILWDEAQFREEHHLAGPQRLDSEPEEKKVVRIGSACRSRLLRWGEDCE